jgi:hypothetical protein
MYLSVSRDFLHKNGRVRFSIVCLDIPERDADRSRLVVF